jgi:hypothetical protein
LRTTGGWQGDVCLVIGDDMKNYGYETSDFAKIHNVQVKHFPNFQFPEGVLETMRKLNRSGMWMEKIFQYHKFHLFDTFFKRWDRIFYIDCGITIFSPIQPIVDTFQPGRLLAHSDAYPVYTWKLRNQFDSIQPYYSELEGLYNIDCDYCQTTIMYYDTNILHDKMVEDLYTLTCRFPNSITNDQGIIALYATDRKLFQQIPTKSVDGTWLYDYLSRGHEKKYVMLKNTVLVCPYDI